MGNFDISAFSLEAGGAAWPLPIRRGTCPAGRGKEAETSQIRELDRGRIVFVFSVEGIVTLKLAFSATEKSTLP